MKGFEKPEEEMFGTYRTILAAMVVLHHFGGYRTLGPIAVYAFFCLSGFLMTLLIDTTYKGRPGSFALNRFLRIYPHYWAVAALTMLLILLGFPISRVDIGIPDIQNLIRNFLYFNYWKDKPTLVLTGWAVTNEIVFYILIGLGISKTPQRSLIWLVASVAIAFATKEYAPQTSDLHYFSPVAASLPFAYGAFLYHTRALITKESAPVLALLFGTAMLVCAAALLTKVGYWTARYMFLAFSGLFAVSMFYVGTMAGKALAKIDNRIGDLSYPIYLNHFSAAMLLGTSAVNPMTGWKVLAVSFVLGAVMNEIIDRRVARLRDRIRNWTPRNTSKFWIF